MIKRIAKVTQTLRGRFVVESMGKYIDVVGSQILMMGKRRSKHGIRKQRGRTL